MALIEALSFFFFFFLRALEAIALAVFYGVVVLQPETLPLVCLVYIILPSDAELTPLTNLIVQLIEKN